MVPAAGLSRRMGVPKLALPFGDSTMIGTVVRTLLKAELAGVVVVTRCELAKRLDLPADARVTVTLHESEEMIDSVRAGLHVLEQAAADARGDSDGLDGVLVVPADIPTIIESTVRACVSAFAEDRQRIVIASHSGRRGHPLVFPFALRHTVCHLEHGLRELSEWHEDRVHLVEVGDAGVEADIDTWEQYARVRQTPSRTVW